MFTRVSQPIHDRVQNEIVQTKKNNFNTSISNWKITLIQIMDKEWLTMTDNDTIGWPADPSTYMLDLVTGDHKVTNNDKAEVIEVTIQFEDDTDVVKLSTLNERICYFIVAKVMTVFDACEQVLKRPLDVARMFID